MKLNLDEALDLKDSYLVEEELPKESEIEKATDKVEDKKDLEAWFNAFVPTSGKSEVVAGEIARAMMRILYRYYNDGDKFFSGYGVETAGGSAQYLMHKLPQHIVDFIEDIADKYNIYEDDHYESDIEKLSSMVVDYLNENPELSIEKNEEDSRHFELDDSYIAKFDYECQLPEELTRHIEAGNISEEDIIAEVEAWDDCRDAEQVGIESDTLHIYQIEEDQYNELTRTCINWLVQLAEMLDDEYGYPQVDESLKESQEEYTIEINNEIYQDENGEPYHFSSAEEAKSFIEDRELKNASITRQHGKAKYEEALEEEKEKYIYLFPELTDSDKFELSSYNLEFLGKNEFEGEVSDVVKGSEEDLRAYGRDYLGYVLHPDYLYKEKDFAGDILTQDQIDEIDLDRSVHDMSKDELSAIGAFDNINLEESNKIDSDSLLSDLKENFQEIEESAISEDEVELIKKFKELISRDGTKAYLPNKNTIRIYSPDYKDFVDLTLDCFDDEELKKILKNPEESIFEDEPYIDTSDIIVDESLSINEEQPLEKCVVSEDIVDDEEPVIEFEETETFSQNKNESEDDEIDFIELIRNNEAINEIFKDSGLAVGDLDVEYFGNKLKVYAEGEDLGEYLTGSHLEELMNDPELKQLGIVSADFTRNGYGIELTFKDKEENNVPEKSEVEKELETLEESSEPVVDYVNENISNEPKESKDINL